MKPGNGLGVGADKLTREVSADRFSCKFLITLLRQLGFSVRTNIEHFVFGEEATMARNKVQLQKGLCETDFDAQYGSEERCHAALVKWRWPEGFECPDCSGKAHCVVTRGSRQLFQCNACRKQTSVRAGTIFAASKLPLRLWFKAIYHLTQSKQGMSSIELSRRLGITQTAAWKMKHKLAQVMLERNATKRLKGKVQMDDAYLGGERPGRPGRGAAGKTPFVAAVETTDDGKPHQIILRRVKAFSKVALRKLASTALSSGAEVVSDGLKCFTAVVEAGCTHTAIVRAPERRPPKRRLSNGSTPRSATSRRRWLELTAPCAKSTRRAISQSSNIASTDDTTSAP
jgi:transposase-like protein